MKWIFILVLFLILLLIENVSPAHSDYDVSGKCIDPRKSKRSILDNACQSIVDYAYFVPASATESDLNRAAISLINDYRLYLLSNSCQVDHLINACNTIYLRCGTDFEDYNGLNKRIAIESTLNYIALPCASTCQRIRQSCFGYLENLYYQNTNSNCSLRMHDYYELIYSGMSGGEIPSPNDLSSSGIYLFNSDSDCVPSQGDDAAVVDVSQMIEDYRPTSIPIYNKYIEQVKELMKVDYPEDKSYKGICHDVSTTVHIPPHQYAISRSVFPQIFPDAGMDGIDMAPLRPSFLVQALLEVAVYDFIQFKLPSWVTSQCYDDVRVLVCKSILQNPQNFSNKLYWSYEPKISPLAFNTSKFMKLKISVNGIGLSDLTYHLPRYATRELCLQTKDSCNTYSLFRSKHLPELPDCNSTSINGFHRSVYHFPEKDQPVYNFRLQNAKMQLSFDKLYITRPNDDALVDFEAYKPICPDEFVYVDDVTFVSDRGSLAVHGSTCSFACLSNLWSTADWIAYKFFVILVSLIAFIFGFYMTIVQLLQEQSKSFIYVMYANSFFLLSTIVLISHVITPEVAFCKSDVVRQQFGVNFCSVQSVVIIFALITGSICWALINLDIYLKVKWQVLAIRHIRALTSLCVIIVSVGVVIYCIKFELLGYREGYGFCLFGEDLDKTTTNLLVLVPMFVFNVCGWIFWKKMTDAYSKYREGSLTDQTYVLYVHTVKVLRYHRFHILIMFYGQIMWATLIIFFFIESIWHSDMTSSIDKWTHCVFNHFHRDDQTDWIEKCGFRPTFYISSHTMTWITMLISSQPIFMFFINYDFLLNTSRKWYAELKFMYSAKYEDIMTADIDVISNVHMEREKAKEESPNSKLVSDLFDKFVELVYGPGADNGGKENNHDMGRPRLLTIVLASDEKFAGLLINRTKRIARVGVGAVRAVARASILQKRSPKVGDVFAAHQKTHQQTNRAHHHGAIVPFDNTADVSNFALDIRTHTKEQIDQYVKKDQEANEMADMFLAMAPPQEGKGTGSGDSTSAGKATTNAINNDAVSRKMIIFC